MLHNKCITYSQINDTIPARIMHINKEERDIIDNDIKRKKDIMFLPTYLLETNLQDEKYGASKYKIVLLGILKDGRKVTVIIDDIMPYFEIRIPGKNAEEQRKAASDILNILEYDEDTKPTKTEIINAKPFRFYQPKCKFLRCYYDKTKSRLNAINIIRESKYETITSEKKHYETTTDDKSCYYRVVCRDYLTTFSTWVTLSDYSKVASDKYKNLKGEIYRVSIKNYKPFTGELTNDLLKDKTMSCCWDIETWSPSGNVPMPDNKEDKMFCISMTFQWVNANDPFLKVCLCDFPADPKPDYLTIVCGSEKNIIRAFGEVFAKMQPEFIFGFNDSDYDWNWLIKRALDYKGLVSYLATCMDSTVPYKPYTDDVVRQRYFKKEMVKVEADSYIDGYALMMPGYIPVDVRTIFRRLYPTAEQTSLSWFLAKNKLGGKEDMPYQRMFAIYARYVEFLKTISKEFSTLSKQIEQLNKGQICNLQLDKSVPDNYLEQYTTLKAELAEINYYCIIDAQRCHDLIKIRSVVMDHREVSNIAYCSVYDAFYRANGGKVRNLTIAIGQTKAFNIRFTNISNPTTDEGKYTGAFVLPPRKGLKTSKLSIDELIQKAQLTKNSNNVESSCQDWLNTSNEEVQLYKTIIDQYGPVVDSDTFDTIEKQHGTLPQKFKTFMLEPIGRPIAGLDFSSLYPSLIRTYNFSPEYCILNKEEAKKVSETGQRLTKVDFIYGGRRHVAYFVWHNNCYDPEQPGFQFGVYPYILDDLFKKRAILKKKMKGFEHRKEEIEALSKEEQNKPEIIEEYGNVVFNRNYLNSKQNALKVFMNTFYGEAGSKISPFFVLEVAAGITSYGQQNLKFALAYVKQNGCGVYYGDSVAEYTPILIRHNGIVKYCEIKDLVNDDQYHNYNDGKEIAFLQNTEVWSDLGWTNIKHVIRHKTNKPMFRVMTHSGLVDVTEDHSILDANGNCIKPEDSLGKALLTKDLPKVLPKVLPKDLPKDLTNETSVLSETSILTDETSVQDKETVYMFTTQIEAARFYHERSVINKNIKLSTKYVDDVLYYLVHCGNYKSAGSLDDKSAGNVVEKIIPLPKQEYTVYDIETDNHHFSAGIGNLVVHNTDSLYISMPNESFTTVDKQYYTGQMTKLDYWTKLVEISFSKIKSIQAGVNAAFFEDNKTNFLSMAYEEFLYPVAFTAKKKYFGIAHENIPNFTPKELFIRGLEVKKRGVSELLRTTCMEIMWACCTPSNLFNLLELVSYKIDEIYKRKWSSTDFVQTGMYRTNKKNVKIITLVERMKQRGIEVKPNERFNYVIVKKYPYTYDMRGCKVPLSIGDKLELDYIAERDGMEIDLDYYMQGSINGQLARLITYHDMFFVEPNDETESALKASEDRIYKNACDYVENYCKKYYTNYNTFGKTHQKIFRTVNKSVSDVVKYVDPLASNLLSANVNYEDFESWFVEFTKKKADKLVDNYGKHFVNFILEQYMARVKIVVSPDKANINTTGKAKTTDELHAKKLEKISHLQIAYYGTKRSILDKREEMYKNIMLILRKRLRENLDKIMVTYTTYNKSLETIMSAIKDKIGISEDLYKPTTDVAVDYKLEDFNFDNDLQDEINENAVSSAKNLLNNDKTITALNELKALYNHMVSAHLLIGKTRSIVLALKQKRDSETRHISRPDTADIQKNIDTNITAELKNLAL